MSGVALGTTASGRMAVGERGFVDRLKLVVLATTVVVLAKAFIVDMVVVDGDSMLPTMHSGDWVLVEKLTPRLGLVRQGQVVLMTATSPRMLMLKRVVAVGGQHVELQYGRAMVDGKPAPTETETIPGGAVWGPSFVPAGDVFVLGDNRAQSEDSRDFGSVPTAQVKGRVMPVASRWATAVTMRLDGIRPGARSEKARRVSRFQWVRPGLATVALGAMLQVETAHITGGGREIWVSKLCGLRRDTARGSTLVTAGATWDYDRAKNEVTILNGAPPAEALWTHLEQIAGIAWLQILTYDAGVGYEYTVVADVLDGRAVSRIETSGGPSAYGATIWIDDETTRVVKIKQWRVREGVRQETHPTVRVDYDASPDPGLFAPSFPPDAHVVDGRTKGRRGDVHPLVPLA